MIQSKSYKDSTNTVGIYVKLKYMIRHVHNENMTQAPITLLTMPLKLAYRDSKHPTC